jgi:hypothetical protein
MPASLHFADDAPQPSPPSINSTQQNFSSSKDQWLRHPSLLTKNLLPIIFLNFCFSAFFLTKKKALLFYMSPPLLRIGMEGLCVE